MLAINRGLRLILAVAEERYPTPVKCTEQGWIRFGWTTWNAMGWSLVSTSVTTAPGGATTAAIMKTQAVSVTILPPARNLLLLVCSGYGNRSTATLSISHSAIPSPLNRNTPKECRIVENIQVIDIISDHMAICFDINIELCEKQHIKTQYRSLKTADLMGMRDDLQNSDLVNKPVDDLDSLVDQFNTTLRTILTNMHR